MRKKLLIRCWPDDMTAEGELASLISVRSGKPLVVAGALRTQSKVIVVGGAAQHVPRILGLGTERRESP